MSLAPEEPLLAAQCSQHVAVMLASPHASQLSIGQPRTATTCNTSGLYLHWPCLHTAVGKKHKLMDNMASRTFVNVEQVQGQPVNWEVCHWYWFCIKYCLTNSKSKCNGRQVTDTASAGFLRAGVVLLILKEFSQAGSSRFSSKTWIGTKTHQAELPDLPTKLTLKSALLITLVFV